MYLGQEKGRDELTSSCIFRFPLCAKNKGRWLSWLVSFPLFVPSNQPDGLTIASHQSSSGGT